jgi:outer membrane immunogenic protein
MKKYLLATTAILTFSGGIAAAADMPLKQAAPVPYLPVISWTGAYVGGIVGVGRLDQSANENGSPIGGHGPCGQYASACVSSATGAVAGAEIGYDFQDRYFVYGVTADWTWTDLNHTVQRSSGSSSYSHTAKIDWLASIRGRMGIAVDSNLVYITGGLALAQDKSNLNETGTDYGSLSGVHAGWVAGGGIEHKFNEHWSFKGEALFYDLGRQTAKGTGPGVGYSSEFTSTVVVGRLGLDYHF